MPGGARLIGGQTEASFAPADRARRGAFRPPEIRVFSWIKIFHSEKIFTG